MLMLARGQLNRAFRKHGLSSPDPMAVDPLAVSDPAELDDPAANGSVHATMKFGDAFTAWAAGMAPDLVEPILEILVQTGAALGSQPGHDAARAAVSRACGFLDGCR